MYPTIACMALFAVGMFLLFGADMRQVDLVGFGLAFGAAALYALYIMVSERTLRSVPPLVSTAYITLSAAPALLLAAMAQDELAFRFAPDGWVPIAGLSVFSTFIAILAFAEGVKRIGSGRSAVISSVEPLFTMALGVLILHEPSALQLWGSAIIVVAVTTLQWNDLTRFTRLRVR